MLLVSILFALASLCTASELNMAKAREMAARCTKLVKDLQVKGVEEYIPTKEEAKGTIENLRDLVKMMKISDKTKREQELEKEPDLQLLSTTLKELKNLEKLSDLEIETTLKKDETLLETVVKFSMLDTKNMKSPIYNMDISTLLKSSASASTKPRCNAFKAKYHKKNGSMKLVFSKVVAPGGRMPDPKTINFHDKKGRSCHCSC